MALFLILQTSTCHTYNYTWQLLPQFIVNNKIILLHRSTLPSVGYCRGWPLWEGRKIGVYQHWPLWVGIQHSPPTVFHIGLPWEACPKSWYTSTSLAHPLDICLSPLYLIQQSSQSGFGIWHSASGDASVARCHLDVGNSGSVCHQTNLVGTPSSPAAIDQGAQGASVHDVDVMLQHFQR